MLKGIDPALSPALLQLMAEMGHDDALLLADANFTAVRYAQGRIPIVRLPGLSLPRVAKAVASVFPLANDVPHPLAFMQVGETHAPYQSAVQREAIAAFAADMLPTQSAEGIERFAFYERAKLAFAFVVTGELQPYANLLVRKGVICEVIRK